MMIDPGTKGPTREAWNERNSVPGVTVSQAISLQIYHAMHFDLSLSPR